MYAENFRQEILLIVVAADADGTGMYLITVETAGDLEYNGSDVSGCNI